MNLSFFKVSYKNGHGPDCHGQLACQHAPQISEDAEQGDEEEYACYPDDKSEGIDEKRGGSLA